MGSHPRTGRGAGGDAHSTLVRSNLEHRRRQAKALAELLEQTALLPPRLLLRSQRNEDVAGLELPNCVFEREHRVVGADLTADIWVGLCQLVQDRAQPL